MLKHLLKKIVHSVTHSKQGHYRLGSSSHRFVQPRHYSSSDHRHHSGYGHGYYKNKYRRYSSS
ncbi:hypothetical protein [Paenibacillus ehimensis]|uniref:hypothetical protein n=1 Tax=Paenibacillus ehimensis TaxID=79264 RepID=UPI00055F5763|nr:hypothetical protein [Paenibacillus ehimensis]